MAFPAQDNTNPEELRRRLTASGPMGFIAAVYYTLEKLGRPYYYTRTVPSWMLANADPDMSNPFAAAYQSIYPPTETEKAFQATPHVIVHQSRMYPANRRTAGTSDSPGGARRQKTPTDVIYHDRPLPSSTNDLLIDYDANQPTLQRALLATGRVPPLWDSIEAVPDIIRGDIQEDTVCAVMPWEFDIFVDFVLMAANEHLLQQMIDDLMYILRFFHDRHFTGASNLAGWFVQSVSGAPGEIASKIRGDIPAHTITWRLKQGIAYAFPVQRLNEIYVDLYGREADL